MLAKLKVYKNYLKSSKVRNRIIVIESDDWGGIRMPSKSVFEILKGKEIDVISNPFNSFDTLETDDDITVLLSLLNKIELKFKIKVKITLNFILANPDFDLIKASKYKQYYFKTFTETYSESDKSQNVFSLIKEGISLGYFQPQFHAREHVDVDRWLSLLQNKNLDVMEAFNNNTFGLSFKTNMGINLWQAYNYSTQKNMDLIKLSIIEGLSLFEDIFGFKSLSTIAPSGVWNNEIEEVWSNLGVKYIQSFVVQKESKPMRGQLKSVFHYTGQKSKNGLMYLVRNCFFEPSTNQNNDWVKICFNQIRFAFFFNKPAVISMHRINFSGDIDKKRRDVSLNNFEILLSKIVAKWPDIKFMSSDELGELISNKNIKLVK